MQYFLLKQDRSYNETPTIQRFNSSGFFRKNFTPRYCDKIKDINMVMSPSDLPIEYLDILDMQVLLVSKEVKQLFSLYDSALRFKMFVMLNNLRRSEQAVEYYAPILREIECVAPTSEFNLDTSYIKRLVLFENKIRHLPIFRVGGILAEAMIVRLDVAESLLRRGFWGLDLAKVEVE